MNVVIADDHELTRDGLALLVRAQFAEANVIEAATFDRVLEFALSGSPCDLVLVDLHMPGFESALDLAALCEALPEARVVVVSGDEQQSNVFDALSCGAKGYVFKSLNADGIRDAIERVLRGEIYVPPSIAHRRKVIDAPAVAAAARQLTNRQNEVFNQLVDGKSSKEIARALEIAEGTVKIHLAAIYRLLGVRTRSEAIAKHRQRRG